MKAVLTVGIAVLCGLASLPTSAADLARRPMPVKAAPAPVVAVFSWTGCYIGAHVGGGWGHKRWTRPSDGLLWGDFDVDGWLAGGQIGCDVQTGSWVFGIEGSGSWTNIKGDGTYPIVAGILVNSKLEWLATATGRIGFAVDRTLFYAKGGGAWVHEKHFWTGGFVTDQPSETRWGWLVGGGIEYAFTGNWSAKAEYNYIDFGKENITQTEVGNPANVFDTRIKQHLHIFKVGLNYRFGGGPVVARY